MHTGDSETARSAPPRTGTNKAADAEQRPSSNQANRQAPPPKACTRPWASRQAKDPSWVEKVEEF